MLVSYLVVGGEDNGRQPRQLHRPLDEVERAGVGRGPEPVDDCKADNTRAQNVGDHPVVVPVSVGELHDVIETLLCCQPFFDVKPGPGHQVHR